MKNDQNNKKQLQFILILFGVMAVVIIGIIALFYNFNDNKYGGDLEGSEKVDKASGETTYNQPNKTPETYGVNPDAPIFLGFSDLYDVGLSQDQVERVKTYLNDYADSLSDKTKVKQISVDKDSISHRVDPKNGDSYIFDIVMDDKNRYRVNGSSIIFDTIDIKVFKDNKLVFDSTKE